MGSDRHSNVDSIIFKQISQEKEADPNTDFPTRWAELHEENKVKQWTWKFTEYFGFIVLFLGAWVYRSGKSEEMEKYKKWI